MLRRNRLMISGTQLEANRRNPQLSTGPRMEEGKRRCSRNGLRHYLIGRVFAMTEEDRAGHDQFCAATLKDAAPEATPQTAYPIQALNQAKTTQPSVCNLGYLRVNGFVFSNDQAGLEDLSALKTTGFASHCKPKVFTRACLLTLC